MLTRLALFSTNDATRAALTRSAVRAGLTVTELAADPRSLVDATGTGVAVRAPGGLVGAAIERGAEIVLNGPTPEWFVGLDTEITGRRWDRLNLAQARTLLASGPVFVKLADAKTPLLPARRYATARQFDDAIAGLGPVSELDLIATTTWLDIVSEYRAFTRHRTVLTCSPYLVEDEVWTPLLHTHRASFHREATEHAASILNRLPDNAVPPTAALDIARLRNGDFVLLEANQSWAAGPYGCDPDAVLQAILVANQATPDERWRWRPGHGPFSGQTS